MTQKLVVFIGLQAMVFDDKQGLIAQFHDGIWRD